MDMTKLERVVDDIKSQANAFADLLKQQKSAEACGKNDQSGASPTTHAQSQSPGTESKCTHPLTILTMSNYTERQKKHSTFFLNETRKWIKGFCSNKKYMYFMKSLIVYISCKL